MSQPKKQSVKWYQFSGVAQGYLSFNYSKRAWLALTIIILLALVVGWLHAFQSKYDVYPLVIYAMLGLGLSIGGIRGLIQKKAALPIFYFRPPILNGPAAVFISMLYLILGII